MARMARSNRRKFVWARQDGVLVPGTNFSEDLLTQFKERAGGQVLIGATVVAVRGYVKPNVAGGLLSRGRVAIRVCNEQDVEGDPPGQGPVADGTENDWMGFWPWIVDGTKTVTGDGTWNVGGSPWAIDVRAQRKMEELNETLGIFYANIAASDDPSAIDYDLSVGLKLA